MPVETATFLSQLNPSNPTATDGLAQGDDQIRLVKAVLQNTFEAFTDDPLESSQEEIDGVVAAIAAGTVKSASGSTGTPGMTFKDDTDTGWSNPSANALSGSVGGQEFVAVSSNKNAAFKAAVSAVGTVTATGGFVGPNSVPIGATFVWWEDTLPDLNTWGRYAWANGATISAADNPVLAARWASRLKSGNTLIRLPDLCDNVPVGKGTMGGASAAGRITNFVTTTLGAMFGACKHVLTTGELPEHNHTVNDPGHTHAVNQTVNPMNNSGISAADIVVSGSGNAQAHTQVNVTGITLDAVGDDEGHNNVQPSVVCNWVIRIG